MTPTSMILTELCRLRETSTVSLYLHATPADRAGERQRIAGLLTRAEVLLGERGAGAQEIAAVIEPLQAMATSEAFSTSRSDRFLFAAPGFLRWRELAHAVGDAVVVGDRPFIRPLLAESAATRFLVLALHQDRVRAYECDVAGLAPAALRLPTLHEAKAEDLLRDDVADTPVDQHLRRDDEQTIRAYFHLLASTLRVARLPGWDHVLLAGTDRNRGLFRAAAAHLTILDHDIVGDPDGLDDREFARRALQAARDASGEAFAAVIDRLRRGDHQRPVQRETTAVLEASSAGEVDCLLIARGAQAWGTPTAAGRFDDHHGVAESGDQDLLNLAAIEVIRHGGIAYEVDAARLDPGDHAVAFLRWCAERYAAVAPA